MTCPSSDQLLELLSGTGSDADVTSHLDDCPTCQREMERLTADADGLGRVLLQPVLRPTAVAAVDSMLDRLGDAHSVLGGNRPAGADEAPVIPRYEILGLLGRGGQGAVYKARDLSLRRVVALKVLGPAGQDDEPRRARFRREAETLAKLRHPNIVQIYEVGEADGRPYFTMEYVPGGTLSATLTGAPHPPREAAALVRVLADAVHAAHVAGVIHRDLKPGNILLKDEGARMKDEGKTEPHGSAIPSSFIVHPSSFPMITDFGLAKSYDSSFDLTHSGMLLGTPTYMAPEQVQTRADAIGPATDVHALGAMLYQMLTGRAPFQGAELIDLLSQVAHAEPLPPRRLLPGLPRDLDTVCLKCLEKDPAKRYPTAAALAEDLRRFLAGEAIVARPVGAAGRGWRWCRRNPALAAALAALAASLVIGIVVASVLAVRANRLAGQRQTALERVTTEEQKTRAALDQARDALDATTDEVLENLLTRQQLGERERAFLRKVLGQYQRLAATAGDDSETARAARASGLSRAAAVRHRLGEMDESLAAGRDAIAVYRRLSDEFPTNPQYRRQLALALTGRGMTLRMAARPAEAAEAYREARDILIPLAAAPDARSELRAELATAHGYLASVYHMTARFADAVAEFRAALEIDRQLVAAHPESAAFRRRKAVTEHNYAWMLAEIGQFAEAERLLTAALPAYKNLLTDPATTPDDRKGLALAHVNLGTVYNQTNRRPAALEAFAEARRIQTALIAEFPAAADFRQYLSATMIAVANTLRDQGRYDDAVAAVREAVDARARLVADFPARPEFRNYLAEGRNTLGTILHNANRLPDAAVAFGEAIATWEKLVAENGDPEFVNSLAGAMVNLSQVRFDQKDPAAARRLLEAALPHHAAALKVSPRNPYYRQFHRNNCRMRVGVILARGDHAAAVAAAEELARCDVLPAQDGVYTAWAFTRCAALVGKDESLPTGPRADAAERYAARAVAMLRVARDKGFRDVAMLKAAPELADLRKRHDFQALVNEMEQKAAEKE